MNKSPWLATRANMVCRNLSHCRPFGSQPRSALDGRKEVDRGLRLVVHGTYRARQAYVAAMAPTDLIPQVTSSAGMAARMAACNLGAAGPMLRPSAGLHRCTFGSAMAVCHAFPTDSRASLLLLMGSHDRTSTRRSTVRAAWHKRAR